MKKYLTSAFVFFILFFANTSRGEIVKDASGNRYITIGSSKDEVLEILGTPRQIAANLNWWYYGSERLSFDGSDRVKEYTNSKALKILLLPSSHTQPIISPSNPSLSNSTSNSSNTSNITKTNPSAASNAYIPTSSGYGEISEKTGRPKTVSVKGYTRKDGTYVKPHYRSSPKRK